MTNSSRTGQIEILGRAQFNNKFNFGSFYSKLEEEEKYKIKLRKLSKQKFSIKGTSQFTVESRHLIYRYYVKWRSM